MVGNRPRVDGSFEPGEHRVLLTVAGLICMALLFAASPFSRQVRWHRAGWAACGSVMAFVLLLEYRHLYGME